MSSLFCRLCATRHVQCRYDLCRRCHRMMRRRRQGVFPVDDEPADEGTWVYIPAMMPVPTTCQPGSTEKIVVLADRFARREELFHPEDSRLLA
jgi:hypothetical protein